MQYGSFATLILGLAAWTAVADDIPPAEVSTLEGVTVTATRSAKEVFQVAETVSVVGREAMQRDQVSHLGDVLENLANVDFGGGPRTLGQRFTIRGIGDQRILFLIDGARQNFVRGHNARLFLDPAILKQVEVVRGPASALWGSGAIGGAVALTTVDATDLLGPGQTSGTRLQGGYQSVNQQWLGGASVYGLGGDTFDYLFHFSYRAADDINLGDDEEIPDSGFVPQLTGLAKFNWTPTLHQTLSFSALTFDQTAKVPQNPQSGISARNPSVARLTQQRNYSLRYRYQNPDLAWLDFSLLAYHNSVFSREKRSEPSRRRDETDFWTAGVNLKNRARLWQDGPLPQVVSVGLDYYHDDARATRDGQPRATFPAAAGDVVGLWLQDEITLWRRLTLTGGVRWDHFDLEPERSGIAGYEASEVTFRAGALWQVTDWLALHFAYHEAFRAPGFNELFVSGIHFTCGPGCANLFVPTPGLKPEKARNKEIGLRIARRDLLTDGDGVRLRATFFRNQVDDFIDSIVIFSFAPVPELGNPGPGGVTTRRNVSEAELEGFEAELFYDLPYGYAGLAYAQTRGEDRKSGEPLGSVMPDKWVVQAGIKVPAWGLTLGWRGRIVEDQDRVPQGVERTDGFTVHDLLLSWQPQGRWQGVRLDLGVDNLTDEDYRQHLAVLKSPGRNFKATVSLRF